MKTTRRQELKTNELLETLRDARDFFDRHGNYVVGAVVVAAVAVLVYVYKDRSASQTLANARQEMRALPFTTDDEVRSSVAALERLAGESKNDGFIRETLRRRAALAISRADAADDGTPSAEFLEMARSAYQTVLERYPNRVLDYGAALTGLATIEEDLFILDQDLSHKEKARQYLELVRDNEALNGMPFQSIALERLNALDQTFVQVAMVDAPRPAPTPEDLVGPPASLAPPVSTGAAAVSASQAPTTQPVVWSPDKQPSIEVEGVKLERISAEDVPQQIRDRAGQGLAEHDAQKAAEAAAKSAAPPTTQPAESHDEVP